MIRMFVISSVQIPGAIASSWRSRSIAVSAAAAEFSSGMHQQAATDASTTKGILASPALVTGIE